MKDIGVPKFLVNQWLGIQPEKSGFQKPENQVDNQDDVSIYSETTTEKSFKFLQSSIVRKSKFAAAKTVKLLKPINPDQVLLSNEATQSSSSEGI